MATKRRRIGGVVYFILLCAWAAALCYGAYYGLGRCWEYAEAFEASRPNHTMDEYVARLSEELWDEEIAETIKAMPHHIKWMALPRILRSPRVCAKCSPRA